MPLDLSALSLDYSNLRPFLQHQHRNVVETLHKQNHALWWEQGTMKTRPIITIGAENFANQNIGAMIVVTDDGIHSNWAQDEIPSWMPKGIGYDVVEFHSKKVKNKTQQQQLRCLTTTRNFPILCMSWAGAVTDAGKAAIWDMLQRKALFVADETTAIKSYNGVVSTKIVQMAQYARMRRILNGTPIDKDPLDLWQQVNLMDPHFWLRRFGLGSYAAFKSYFAVVKKMYFANSPEYNKPAAEQKGRAGVDFYPTIVTFKNLPELRKAMTEIGDRVLKDDVLDLPPKTYLWELYQPSEVEQRLYNQIEEESVADLDGPTVECVLCQGSGELAEEECPKCLGMARQAAYQMTATLPIVKMLRFQQILSGFATVDAGHNLTEPTINLPGPKPRLAALERVMHRASTKPQIVFARFKKDIDNIRKLCADMNLSVGAYDGRTGSDERTRIRHAFQAGDLAVFLGNQAACAKGITLTAAHHVTYFNNLFRLSFRLQSEDRAHRGVMEHKVTYTDVAVHGGIDWHIAKNLKNKIDVAAAVTGDRLKQWLM